MYFIHGIHEILHCELINVELIHVQLINKNHNGTRASPPTAVWSILVHSTSTKHSHIIFQTLGQEGKIKEKAMRERRTNFILSSLYIW